MVLLPLLGLSSALQSPPADPFTGETHSWWGWWQQSGASGLLLNSLLLGLGVSAGALLLGTWLAWVEQRARLPWVQAASIACLLPLATPSYLLAAVLKQELDQLSVSLPGLSISTGLPLAMLCLIVVTTPLVQLLVGAALRRCPAAEEEAARSLGASSWEVFWRVTFPRLRPALGFSSLLAMLYAISDFGAVAVLDCPVLTWRLYDAVRGQELGAASALGAATMLAVLPLFMLARGLRGGSLARGSANPRPLARRDMGLVSTTVTVGLWLILISVGFLLPSWSLMSWTLEGWDRSLTFVSPWDALTGSLLLALLGALLTTLLAWLPAWQVAAQQRRSQARRASWMEEAVYLTSALPGVLLAMGLIQAALAVARAGAGADLYHGLLRSGLLLFLGYATRFLAEAYAPLKSGLLSLDPRQEESARALGATRWKRLTQVTLPSMRPALAVSFLLGFNAIVKELPVTLLLGGATGLRTLSFRVWDRYSESLWHDAGLAGLMLIGLALLSLLATLPWRRNA